MRVLLLFAALGACTPAVASTAHVGRVLGPVVVDHTEPIAIKTDTVEGVVIVRAVQPRVCIRAVFDDYVDQGEGKVFEPAVPTKRREQIAMRRRPCPIPAAHALLEITLPSGQLLQGTTDRTGAFFLVLPDSENALEVRITARAAPSSTAPSKNVVSTPAPPVPVPPKEAPHAPAPQQGMAGVRDVVVHCGRAFGITGTARLRLYVNNGRASAKFEHSQKDFARCVTTNVANAKFPASTNLEMTISFLVAKP